MPTPEQELRSLITAAEADLERIPATPWNARKIADRQRSLEGLRRLLETVQRQSHQPKRPA